jgi:hypothetical protein
MTRCAILLRGINIGPNNRIPMAELRSLLTQDGFGGVTTYLQSGNVLLSSSLSPEAAARRCEHLIAEGYGLEIRSVVRTHLELEAVVRANPLPEAAADPKRYQVTFLESALTPTSAPGSPRLPPGRSGSRSSAARSTDGTRRASRAPGSPSCWRGECSRSRPPRATGRPSPPSWR